MIIIFITSRKKSNINVRLIFKDSINKLNSMLSRLDTQLGVNSFLTSNEPKVMLNPASANTSTNPHPENKKTNKNNINNNSTIVKEEVTKAANVPAENKG